MRVVSRNGASSAFTLAEVLVTLAIIGVLTAITIPTLLQNMQEQELKTAFKKTYSEVAQATQKVLQDNGGTMLGICADTDYNCLKDKYAAHLNVIKNCDASKAFGNCWTTSNNFKYLNNEPMINLTNFPAVILNNGIFVRFTIRDDDCQEHTYSKKGECGFISIDVNGFKKPNTVGRDIFYVHIYKDGIAPRGVPDDTNLSSSSTCNKNDSGFGCAALVLQDIDY